MTEISFHTKEQESTQPPINADKAYYIREVPEVSEKQKEEDIARVLEGSCLFCEYASSKGLCTFCSGDLQGGLFPRAWIGNYPYSRSTEHFEKAKAAVLQRIQCALDVKIAEEKAEEKQVAKHKSDKLKQIEERKKATKNIFEALSIKSKGILSETIYMSTKAIENAIFERFSAARKLRLKEYCNQARAVVSALQAKTPGRISVSTIHTGALPAKVVARLSERQLRDKLSVSSGGVAWLVSSLTT